MIIGFIDFPPFIIDEYADDIHNYNNELKKYYRKNARITFRDLGLLSGMNGVKKNFSISDLLSKYKEAKSFEDKLRQFVPKSEPFWKKIEDKQNKVATELQKAYEVEKQILAKKKNHFGTFPMQHVQT